MTTAFSLSVVIPVSERYDDVEALYHAYKIALESLDRSCEFIYVLDGEFPAVFATLDRLRRGGEPIKIVTLAKWFGEATALTIGFAHATGEIILTLPAYRQVEPQDIPQLVRSLDGYHMVVARRFPRRDSRINLFQSKAFHFVFEKLLMRKLPFRDLGCSARALRREVVDEVQMLGDQHRFLPLLASQQGFKVREIDLTQAHSDVHRRLYRPGVYLRRLLDMLTVVFITKFTKKPLRFFGLIGTFVFALGTLGAAYLSAERIFFDVTLADRPALVLAVLMIVMGFQMIAVGLIGELIIFIHGKEIKEYTVDRVIEHPHGSDESLPPYGVPGLTPAPAEALTDR
jgi:glycosyltransferase involved in cell wall biosynthesis